MPVLPTEAEETVCEINREFLTRRIDLPEDSNAQEQYAKVLNRSFPKVAFKKQYVLPENVAEEQAKSQTEEQDLVRATAAAVEETLDEALGEPPLSFIQKLGSLFRKKMDYRTKQGQAISWHKHKLYLAFIADHDHVLVVDYEDTDPKTPYVLSHDTQQHVVEALEWRPNSGSTLAVGCRGGVCIWTASHSYPGSMLPVRTIASLGGTPVRTGRWTLVDFLRWGSDMPITALSWSPCGRLLACGSVRSPTFAVWDVSLGESTPLRRGLAGIQLLNWSPQGDYLLCGKVDSSFHIWETMTWTSEPWSSAGGTLSGSSWSPDGGMILCSFQDSTTLGSLNFSGKPPSLEVHLLPLELPGITSITGNGQGGSIELMAWDGSGERLAVSYSGGEKVDSGLIAVYDTRKSPIISASLLGFVRGPGEGAKPLSFCFHERFKQGALLGVCWSTGILCVYPLLFKG